MRACACVCVCVRVFLYRERGRERERDVGGGCGELGVLSMLGVQFGVLFIPVSLAFLCLLFDPTEWSVT